MWVGQSGQKKKSTFNSKLKFIVYKIDVINNDDV